MRRLLKRFMRDERGLELSEYAIMIALLIAVAVMTISAVGGQIDQLFQDLLAHLSGAP